MFDCRTGCPLPLQVEVSTARVAAEGALTSSHGATGGDSSVWDDKPYVMDSAKYAVYGITVTLPLLGAEWMVERRFSDFTMLRSYLASLYVAIPSLPPKTLLRILSDSHLEVRRKCLSEWLNVLCGRRDVLSSQTLHHFLGVDAHCKNVYTRLLAALSYIPVPAKIRNEEEEERTNQLIAVKIHPQLLGSHTDANFGFQDAQYLKRKGLLVTISNDFSLASRVDSLVSNTLSVLTEAAIPLSSFGVHTVNYVSSYSGVINPLFGRHPQRRPCTGSSDGLSSFGAMVCGEGNYRSGHAPFPLEMNPELIHYFSKRVTAMAVSQDENIIFLGFESGSVAVYKYREPHGEEKETSAQSKRRSTESEDNDSVDLSEAFHESDGRHLNRPLDGRFPHSFESLTNQNTGLPENGQTASGFVREDESFPLLPQAAGTIHFMEIIPDLSDGSTPSLLICGGDDRQIQVYDIKRRTPRPECTLHFTAVPRCVKVHDNNQSMLVGFDDESIALIGFSDGGPPRVLAKASSQRVLSRQGKGDSVSNGNRVMFLSFVNLPADRTLLNESIPASLSIEPDCESMILSGLRDGSVALWAIKQREGSVTLKLTGRISRPCVDTLQRGVSGLDNATLVIGTKQGVVTVLCPFDGQPLFSFAAHWRSSSLSSFKQGSGHSEGISSLRWIDQESNTVLLTASRDGSVNFWSWPLPLRHTQTVSV